MTDAHNEELTVGEVGEKAIIETLLRPLFNPNRELNSVGDDCAALTVSADCYALVSTDRVPADLISFKSGVITPRELGRYLGVLNLSDVAACGGTPIGLLFNCGMPRDFAVTDLMQISEGLHSIASEFGAHVVGGDITSSSELNLSATVIGQVPRDRMLRRSGARSGDSVFVTRPIGLSPVALEYCLRPERFRAIADTDRVRLVAQFNAVLPEIHLGQSLSQSRLCSAAMDNTDGVGQSLTELARESQRGIVIDGDTLELEDIVLEAAARQGVDPVRFAMGAGADFGLVGTLKGNWSNARARQAFGDGMRIIGTVVEEPGVLLARVGIREPLVFAGWNYFQT